MQYMKNHFQREVWVMFFWPYAAIFVMFLMAVRYARLIDFLSAALVGIIGALAGNLITKFFSHAFIFSILFAAALIFTSSLIFPGLLPHGILYMTILAIPSCLITTWLFAKYRQKRDPIKETAGKT